MIEPLTTTAPLIGSTVAVVVGGLALFAMLALPALRAPAMLLGLARWLSRYLTGLLHRRAILADPTRPLRVAGLSTPLARLILQTRTTALELRRCSTEAGEWPEETAPLATPRSGWRESLFGGARSPLTEVRGEVFEWMRVVETLPTAEREVLVGLGVDIDAVRRALTDGAADRPARDVVRALAGLLWDIDERLAGASPSGYRASGGEHAAVIPIHDAPAPPLRTDDSESRADDRVHRARWAGTLADPTTVADPGACIESAILRADQRARIEQALTDLPDTLESVLTLHLTGRSDAQIAETLGISERNVSVRLSRARAHLRRQLVAA